MAISLLKRTIWYRWSTKTNLITALSNAGYIVTISEMSVTQCIKNDVVYSFNYFKGRSSSQHIVICLETSDGIIPLEFMLIVNKLIQVADVV